MLKYKNELNYFNGIFLELNYSQFSSFCYVQISIRLVHTICRNALYRHFPYTTNKRNDKGF